MTTPADYTPRTSYKNSVYARLLKAWKKKAGVRLTAQDVDTLLADDSVRSVAEADLSGDTDRALEAEDR